MDQVFALRDPVSAGTHFAGFLWAIFGAVLLCRLCRDDQPKKWSLACFGVTLVALYAASATYHALRLPAADLRLFRLLDHSAIFGLIAGTYTPIFFVLLQGRRRDVFLGAIWGLALLGIGSTWLLPDKHYALTVGIYLAMGWFGVLSVAEMARFVSLRALALGLLGGLCYSAGAVCDVAGWPVLSAGLFGSHEVLHVLVLAGSLCHFLFIFQYVLPYPRCRVIETAPAMLPLVPADEVLVVAGDQ